jgi:hypothetical protein
LAPGEIYDPRAKNRSAQIGKKKVASCVNTMRMKTPDSDS